MIYQLEYDMPALIEPDVMLALESDPTGELPDEPIIILDNGDVAREVWAPLQAFLDSIAPDRTTMTLDTLVERLIADVIPGLGVQVSALIGLAQCEGFDWEVYAEAFHCERHDRVEVEYVGHIAREHRTLTFE